MLLNRTATETVLAQLPEDEFVRVWTDVVGEVPAALIERPVMVDLLLGGSGKPAKPRRPARKPARSRLAALPSAASTAPAR